MRRGCWGNSCFRQMTPTLNDYQRVTELAQQVTLTGVLAILHAALADSAETEQCASSAYPPYISHADLADSADTKRICLF